MLACIVSYMAIGLLQLFALIDAIQAWWGIPGVLSWVVAAVIAYVPFVGAIMSIMAVVKLWGWGVLGAIALFSAPYVLGAIALGTGAMDA